MNADKRNLYIVTLFATVAAFLALILPLGASLYPKLLFMAVSAALVMLFVKPRGAKSIYKYQVLLLMTVIALLCVILLYFTGLRFGFITTVAGQKGMDVFGKIIPTVLIIIATELIRSRLISQGYKLISILAYFICLFAEIGLTVTFGQIDTFNRFMDAVGLALIPAVASNLAMHYISKDYGVLPTISYRIITSIYSFVLAVEPYVPDVLMSAAGTVVPLLALLFIRALYVKKIRKVEKRKNKVIYYISAGLTALFMISLVMRTSCEFRYCALVIATESMTGEINKGDAAFYEKYDDQHIDVGQVIVFKEGKSKIVHRVVEIATVNGATRYYTKGDANDTNDSGYRTDADIEGVVLFKMPYIGYPTLMLNEAFSK